MSPCKRPPLLPFTNTASPNASSDCKNMETTTAATTAAATAAIATRRSPSSSSRWTPFGKNKRRRGKGGGPANGYGSTSGANARRTPEVLLQPRSSPLDERSQLLVAGVADDDDDDDHDHDHDAANIRDHGGSGDDGSASHIIIASFEMALRLVVLLAALFWLGTMLPGQTSRAARIVEYAVVAWGTIVALRLVMIYQTQPKSCCRRVLLYRSGGGAINNQQETSLFDTAISDDEENPLLLDIGEEDDIEILDRDETGGPGQEDPSLAALYIVDTASRIRAVFNDQHTTLALETDYFTGQMLIYIRAPAGGGPTYFYGKQRRFEFQYQVVLKKVPEGIVYFGCSLPQQQLKLNLMQRTLVNAAMAFCRASNPDLSYSLHGDNPYMAFPVVTGMNRVVESVPGETPPPLGSTIEAKQPFDGVWKLHHTYTFALWSAYVDFVEWKVLNLPAIRPFSLASIVGRQPIEMNLFVNADPDQNIPRIPICKLELCHAEHSGLGPHAATATTTGDDTTVVDDDLAAGIYVRSGDPLWLQHQTSFCANGGGFCVLQEQVPTKIRIITADRKPLKLIQNGEAVFLKLEVADEPSKYLTVHRGWWLKWASTAPTVNGFFTIHWDESAQGNSQYLTLNGIFWLNHQRWSKFRVGVVAQGSATYGGRLMGLHVPEEEDEEQHEEGEWLQPLELQAMECEADLQNNATLHSHSNEEDETESVRFGSTQSRMDVPALIESVNRQKRTSQYAYVVRVISPLKDNGTKEQEAYVRFRTGRDLSTVMKIGAKWRNSVAGKANTAAARPTESAPATPVGRDGEALAQSVSTPDGAGLLHTSVHSFDMSISEDDWDIGSEGAIEADDSPEEGDGKQNNVKPSKNLIGKIARSVKSTTSSAARTTGNAGKRVVSHSLNAGKATVNVGKATVNVGKATVNVGKAMLPIRSKKPPAKEPKSAKRGSRRQRRLDLRVDVNSRSMKKAGMLDDNIDVTRNASAVGELTAQEQSCRTVSGMVTSMSSLSDQDPSSNTFSRLLASLVNGKNELDKSFLKGGAVEVGITIADSVGLLKGSLVARCLWESHWREEWLGLYDSKLVLYAPLTTEHCLELSFEDIKNARLLASTDAAPLAGYPLLVIETTWLCHYFAFSNADKRRVMFECIQTARESYAKTHEESMHNEETNEKRFCRGLESARAYARDIGASKWSHVSSNAKQKSRVILNNRRKAFDFQDDNQGDYCSLIEKSLGTALSLTVDSMRRESEKLMFFLNCISRLRNLPLSSIDLSSPDAFCLLVNIYHCLLQHALLFSVNGPLHKKSFRHFMRTSCYEVGCDVFSLAELYCCVIRGNMCRSLLNRPPFMDVAKHSDAYRSFSLPYRCAAVNLLLHTGECSYPETIPVLNPIELEMQLDQQAREYFLRNVTVDEHRKTIFLPKLLEVLRADFVCEADGLLNYLVVYLNERTSEIVQRLVEDDSAIVKFQFPAEQFYADIKSNQEYELKPGLADESVDL
jgi:Protein of unknown function (DUF1769)/Protein of unknown function, DUF547